MAVAKGSGGRAPWLGPLVCPAVLGDQGGSSGRNTPKQCKRENLSPTCLSARAMHHSHLSCPLCFSMGDISGETGQTSMSRISHGPAHAGNSEGMTDILTASLSKIPHHVVSGHLQSWHGVALGPSLYLLCSSSFLEPLLYHILSIPST